MEQGAHAVHGHAGNNGYELWKSDGNESGTTRVKDINPGSAGSYHTAFTAYTGEQPGFTAFDGALYFLANDGVYGYELWKSDGTTAGAVLVKDINLTVSPTGSSSPYLGWVD